MALYYTAQSINRWRTHIKDDTREEMNDLSEWMFCDTLKAALQYHKQQTQKACDIQTGTPQGSKPDRPHTWVDTNLERRAFSAAWAGAVTPTRRIMTRIDDPIALIQVQFLRLEVDIKVDAGCEGVLSMIKEEMEGYYELRKVEVIVSSPDHSPEMLKKSFLCFEMRHKFQVDFEARSFDSWKDRSGINDPGHGGESEEDLIDLRSETRYEEHCGQEDFKIAGVSSGCKNRNEDGCRGMFYAEPRKYLTKRKKRSGSREKRGRGAPHHRQKMPGSWPS